MSVKTPRNAVVTHSNSLTEARYTLTVAEQRLVITLISFISPDDEDFKDYEIKISDFQKLLDIKTKAIYSQTKDILTKLGSRVIHIPKDDGYIITHWFSSAEYNSNNGSVLISFDKKLKPYLLQLKEQFTQYKLFTVAQFQSSYTVRIYMFLKQYEKIGFREIDLVEFRYMLDIDNNKYSEFKELRKWVINKSKSELEKKNKNGHLKSDITFDLETIRTGRKITRLRFNIRKQKYQEQLPFDVPETEPLKPAVQALVDHKISENLARQFEAEQGEAEILQCVTKYEERIKSGKVKDTNGGYLLEMLKGRAGKQSKAEKEQAERAEKKVGADKEKAKEDARKEAFRQAQNKAIADFRDGVDEEQRSPVIQAFEASGIFKRHVSNKLVAVERYKTEGVGCPMVSPFYRMFIIDNYLSEEFKSIENYWKD